MRLPTHMNFEKKSKVARDGQPYQRREGEGLINKIGKDYVSVWRNFYETITH